MAAKRKYSPRKIGTMVDVTHIVIGIVTVVMAGLAIFNPNKYKGLFPIIFLLAAVLSLVTSWYMFVTGQRNSGKILKCIGYLIVGILLSTLFVISAISIWLS